MFPPWKERRCTSRRLDGLLQRLKQTRCETDPMRSALLPALLAATAAAADVPRFRTQEIETGLGVGYAVLLVDVNRDKKTDVVVVDSKRVVWYENPAWRRRTIVEGKTKPDNVCAAAFD